ncbi:unnamed protein product [Echinostoma caproni]|uniref:Uncharacterized protein n=1 Tax=Echinostoma caproni TaxID=27848 RepID=A0A183A0H9_9TREM|nr:unnamed protein product [Echinostoma caproni]
MNQHVFLPNLSLDCAHIRELHTAGDSGDASNAVNQTSRTAFSRKAAEYPVITNVQRQCRKLRSLLGQSLAAFLSTSAGGPYALRRLLAGDVKQLFRRSACGQLNEHPRQQLEHDLPDPDPASGLKRNRVKGGYIVTSYLTIDS